MSVDADDAVPQFIFAAESIEARLGRDKSATMIRSYGDDHFIRASHRVVR